MPAISLPSPGTSYGPCTFDCRHLDCADARKAANTPCRFCKEPIGYDNPYFRDEDGPAHYDCLMNSLPAA